jgi:CheY-like chemotaxis protein
MSVRSLILLVEDSRDDAFFLRRAFLKAGFSHPIVDVRNGQQAVNYLSGNALYADRSLYPLPKLLVVDLKMPLMDGFELLGWLRNRPGLETLPAIVISSSDLPADREKAMSLGAREYFVKPNDPADLIKLVEGLHAKWMDGGIVEVLKH